MKEDVGMSKPKKHANKVGSWQLHENTSHKKYFEIKKNPKRLFPAKQQAKHFCLE